MVGAIAGHQEAPPGAIQDAAIVRTTAERMLADGRGALSFFADTRPVAAEIAATYSIHAGRTVTGWPTLTLRRGEIVYRDGGQRRAAAPRTVAGSAALTG